MRIILNNLRQTLTDTIFIADHRDNPADFSRSRRLTFQHVVLFFLQGASQTLKFSLDTLFQALGIPPTEHHVSVSSQAVSVACRKLSFTALQSLFRQLVVQFDTLTAPPAWMGFRLVAVDGTKLRLPRSAAMAAHFGVQTNGGDDPRPMALLVTHYDVAGGFTRAAELAPCAVGERFLAERLLDTCSTNDILLYDRGFPSFALFALHQQRQVAFCMRLPKAFNAQVADFVRSNEVEQCITLHPGSKARRDCQLLDIPSTPIRIRLIRVRLSSDQIEVLATSLLDAQAFPAHLFKDLYARRWAVEESYKALKQLAAIERYRNRDPDSIYREVYARLITTTLVGFVRYAAGPLVKPNITARQLRHQINFSNTFRVFTASFAQLFHPDADESAIESMLRWVADSVVPVRPGRSFSRKSKNHGPLRHAAA